jgi:hypothetical protein
MTDIRLQVRVGGEAPAPDPGDPDVSMTLAYTVRTQGHRDEFIYGPAAPQQTDTEGSWGRPPDDLCDLLCAACAGRILVAVKGTAVELCPACAWAVQMGRPYNAATAPPSGRDALRIMLERYNQKLWNFIETERDTT